MRNPSSSIFLAVTLLLSAGCDADFADDNSFAESSELDGEGPAELASELAGESRVGQVIGS